VGTLQPARARSRGSLMPMPRPRRGESESAFVSRCMGTPVMEQDYPTTDQHLAVCYSQWDRRKKDVVLAPTLLVAWTTEELEFLAGKTVNPGERDPETGRFISPGGAPNDAEANGGGVAPASEPTAGDISAALNWYQNAGYQNLNENLREGKPLSERQAE